MTNSLWLNLSALIALVPASLAALLRRPVRDTVFWATLGAATVGPAAWATAQFGAAWSTGLAAALWATIAVTMVIFLVLTLWMREAWRLAALLVPYLFVLGAMATWWHDVPGRPLSPGGGGPWLAAHIAISLATYALLTIAAAAGLAVALQERALKAKRRSGLAAALPSVADGERLELRLLAASEIVLGAGLLTGIALRYVERIPILQLDHKTLFSVLTFVLIALLLATHRVSGVRGRRAARLVLAAYVLLTLAFPGVKFVTDILIG